MMTCPKCHGQMRVYERSGVTIDQCNECRGIFLDRGELEKLFEAESNWNKSGQQAPPRPAPGPPPAAPGYAAPGYAAPAPPPAYGQPAYGQPAYGQPAYGHAGYHGHYRGGHHGHYRHRKSFLHGLFD